MKKKVRTLDFYGFDDGIYAGLRFASLLEKQGKLSSDLTKDMNKLLSTPEIRINIDDDIKFEVIDKIKNYAKEHNYNAVFVDGVRVNYDDGFALVRASNTSPCITMRFEASTEELLNKRKNEFLSLVNKFK